MRIAQAGDIWKLSTLTNPVSVDHYLLIEHRKSYSNGTYKHEEAWIAIHLEEGETSTVWIDKSTSWTKVG